MFPSCSLRKSWGAMGTADRRTGARPIRDSAMELVNISAKTGEFGSLSMFFR